MQLGSRAPGCDGGRWQVARVTWEGRVAWVGGVDATLGWDRLSRLEEG